MEKEGEFSSSLTYCYLQFNLLFHHTVSLLLFINEESNIRCQNQLYLSIPHCISASPCCSHAAKSPAFHKIHLHNRNCTDTAPLGCCLFGVFFGGCFFLHLKVQWIISALFVYVWGLTGAAAYVWTKPCWAIAPCCTPAGSSHSAYSSGISLSSPLCINQAAGRLRNMTNTLARISPAVKTQGGRGILN